MNKQLLIAGVDEVGRGPLLGEVVAAAVILNPKEPIQGLNDSKKLSEKKREDLFVQIKRCALAWSIANASVEEIDRINILQASLLAMKRAVDGLSIKPDHVLVDGNKLPVWDYSSEAKIGGDASEPAIAAASILAKVSRDRQCLEWEKRYPGYGIAAHKGYPTKKHLEALKLLGPTPLHRKSFSPVRQLIVQPSLID